MNPVTSPSMTDMIGSQLEDRLHETIAGFFKGRIAMADELDRNYSDVWREIQHQVRSGGKLLRPKLLLLTYESLGGREPEAILPVAASLELLHMSMLIHDDIIDRDDTRRGIDNLAGVYKKKYATNNTLKSGRNGPIDSDHFALSTALLAGDMLLSSCYELLNDTSIPADIRQRVTRQFGRSVFEVCGGELLDTQSSLAHISGKSALAIARYKTSSYSFVCPLVCGAYLAGADLAMVRMLQALGQYVGVAYQLRDDLLGVTGDAAVTGKSTESDIREGKHTYIVTQFDARASQDQKKYFWTEYGNESITPEAVESIKQLLDESGAIQSTEALIETYYAECDRLITDLAIDEAFKQKFQSFIDSATKRTR